MSELISHSPPKVGGRASIATAMTHPVAAVARSASFTHGVYSQMHRLDLASFQALRSYRTFNPASPVHLVSDGGDDLACLAEAFHCHYVHEPVNNGTYRRRHAGTNQYVWITRLYQACLTTLAGVDWVLILESDVECFRAPSCLPRFPLSGGPHGSAWSAPMQVFLSQKWGQLVRRGGLGYCYRGCGGSIFHREAFIESYSALEYSVFEQGCQLDPRVMIAEDAALSFVLQFNGFDNGPWEELARADNAMKHTHAFAHGNKSNYHKPIPGLLENEATGPLRASP